MTIIALPASGHDHLADALVRRGFRRVHVDQPVRDFLTAVDPMVDQRTQFVNMGPGPRLSSKLSAANGEWARLDRDGKLGPEVQRLVDNTRAALPIAWMAGALLEGDDHDAVLGGLDRCTLSVDVARAAGAQVVAIAGRGWDGEADHLIDEGELIAQEAALVACVQDPLNESMRTGKYVQAYAVVDDRGAVTERGVRNAEGGFDVLADELRGPDSSD